MAARMLIGSIGAAAQECGSFFVLDSEVINKQDDLDALREICTTLVEDYQIMGAFTGPFVLPGIANASRLNAGDDGTLRSVDIPSFEMADLEYVDELWLIRLDELRRFWSPDWRLPGL
jgi:hypothetical protein